MKGIFRNLHRYVFWLIISAVFWAWIFTLITDAPAGKKLVLYADVPAMERQTLAQALEQDLPEHIRFVEARMFMDEMFSPANVTGGDLFIVSAAEAEGYLSSFQPLARDAFSDLPAYESGGAVYGVCVYDEAAGIRIAARYVGYQPGERYYLFFNADSQHLGDWNGSPDDAALRAARTLLALP